MKTSALFLLFAAISHAEPVTTPEALVQAVKEAGPGSVVELSAGTFRLAEPLVLPAGLTLKGPLTAVIKADAKAATNGSLSWRTQEQPDVLPANLVRFGIPAGASAQSITLPVDGQAIHVRLNLGDQAEGLRLRSIELRSAKGTADVADFGR